MIVLKTFIQQKEKFQVKIIRLSSNHHYSHYWVQTQNIAA